LPAIGVGTDFNSLSIFGFHYGIVRRANLGHSNIQNANPLYCAGVAAVQEHLGEGMNDRQETLPVFRRRGDDERMRAPSSRISNTFNH
jgi:hypothetical protein